jgi:hypothetical protein
MGEKKARSGEPEGLPDLTDTTVTHLAAACQAGKPRSERQFRPQWGEHVFLRPQPSVGLPRAGFLR